MQAIFQGRVFGGACLVASTTIGVGMLGLPVATGSAGLVPTLLNYVLCYLAMISTAFLLVEACLWIPPNTSFISMANHLIGRWGRYVFWIAYLFLFTTLMIAHVAAAEGISQDLLGWFISGKILTIVYVALIIPAVYMGAHAVGRISLAMITGVAICYCMFIWVSWEHLSSFLLRYMNWSKIWIGMPVIVTAFTFQMIIPTLMSYMHRNVPNIRKAIWIGSSVPFVVYALWEAIILGIVPTQQLISAAALGQSAIQPLEEAIGYPFVIALGKSFAFFAITTSFVPLSLSFFDFLADGLHIQKQGVQKVLLVLAIFVFPTIIAMVYPDIFLIALGYAGGISCAFLFGLMPPVLVWIGRYVKKYPQHPQLFGGKPLLAALAVFSFLIIIGEIIRRIIAPAVATFAQRSQ